MNGETFEALAGVKVVTLVCAFIGAALGISYRPQITPRVAIAALVSGVFFGGFSPSLIEFAFAIKMPITVSNMTAAVCAIGGIFVVPGIISLWKSFFADPFAFLDKVRALFGKGGDK